MDALYAKLESIEARLPPGTPVDVPVKTLEDKLLQEIPSPVRERQSVSTLKGSLNSSTTPTNADLSTVPHLQLSFKPTLVQKTEIEDCKNKENEEREPKRIHNEIMNEPDSAIAKRSYWLRRVVDKPLMVDKPPTPCQQNKHEMNMENLQFKQEDSPNFTMSSSPIQRSYPRARETLRRRTNDDGWTPVLDIKPICEQEDEEAADDANLRASLLNDSGSSFDPGNISLIGGCIECVKAVPVFSADEIEEGDHIVFAGAVYNHHAIVVEKMSNGEKFRIVEATNTLSEVTVGLFLGRKARITISDQTLDFSKQKIWVVVYRRRLFSKSDVSKRAKRFAEGTDDKYIYDLFDNNCEHFATYCVTGVKFSIQVDKIRLTLRLFYKSGFDGISDEKKRNEKEFETKIICEQCYEMNKKLFSVTATPIEAAEDVQVGDIIRYSYYNLWHDAVVLEITHTQTKFMKCLIAHYAFCGLFSHRTIQAEEYKINFDGQCSKLEYASPDYHVYDPDAVVERAKSRLGEQQFVFFSNDSSHYARWCKLKLEKQ